MHLMRHYIHDEFMINSINNLNTNSKITHSFMLQRNDIEITKAKAKGNLVNFNLHE